MVFTMLIHLKVVIILAVLFWCTPLQIAQLTVSFDTIEVSALHAIRTGASESLQYKAMNSESFELATNWGEVDSKVSLGAWIRFQSLPFAFVDSATAACDPRSPHTPIAPDAITGIANDVSIFNCLICVFHTHILAMVPNVVRA